MEYFRRDVASVSGDDFAPFLWTFVDADGSPTGIHENLANPDANLYIIFSTSPERNRWKPLTKTTHCGEIIMNPWYLEEIRLAAKTHLTDKQQSLAEVAFERHGPTLRITSISSEIRVHMSHICETVRLYFEILDIQRTFDATLWEEQCLTFLEAHGFSHQTQ